MTFNCHYSTDLSVKVKPKQIWKVQDLQDWKFSRMAKGPPNRGSAFQLNGMNLIEAMSKLNAKLVSGSDVEALNELGQRRVGDFMVISSDNYRPVYDFLFRHYWPHRLLKHSEPFGKSFGVFAYNKYIDRRKVRFIKRYAYTLMENGFLFKTVSNIDAKNRRTFGYHGKFEDDRDQIGSANQLKISFFTRPFHWLFIIYSVILFYSPIIRRCFARARIIPELNG